MSKDKRKEIKEFISQTKSYEPLEKLCGSWNGEIILKEIEDTLKGRIGLFSNTKEYLPGPLLSYDTNRTNHVESTNVPIIYDGHEIKIAA